MISILRPALLFTLVCPALYAASPAAETVLIRAITYHDPDGGWPTLHATFHFDESRPDGRATQSTMELDNARSFMRVDMGGKESFEISGVACVILSGDKDEQRGLMIRNYFLYLWGLPMKLLDPGTEFDPIVGSSEINGFACDVLRVIYEKDTWYFHLDRESGRMRQYEFYKDTTQAAGEIITLEGEIVIGTLRIPQKRNWYKIPGNEYLGTDILSRIEQLRK